MLILKNFEVCLGWCICLKMCTFFASKQTPPRTPTPWFQHDICLGKKHKHWIRILEFICMLDWNTNEFTCSHSHVLNHTVFSSWWSLADSYSTWSRTRRCQEGKPCTIWKTFPRRDVPHVLHMCNIQAAGEQVAHWEKSWQWVWAGRNRKTRLRQDHYTILLKTLCSLQSIPLCILRAASSQMTPFGEIYFIQDESLLPGQVCGELGRKGFLLDSFHSPPRLQYLLYITILFFLSPPYLSMVHMPVKGLGIMDTWIPRSTSSSGSNFYRLIIFHHLNTLKLVLF